MNSKAIHCTEDCIFIDIIAAVFYIKGVCFVKSVEQTVGSLSEALCDLHQKTHTTEYSTLAVCPKEELYYFTI